MLTAHRSQAGEEKEIPVTAHYKQAEVEGKLYKLGDCVHVHVSFLPVTLLALVHVRVRVRVHVTFSKVPFILVSSDECNSIPRLLTHKLIFALLTVWFGGPLHREDY